MATLECDRGRLFYSLSSVPIPQPAAAASIQWVLLSGSGNRVETRAAATGLFSFGPFGRHWQRLPGAALACLRSTDGGREDNKELKEGNEEEKRDTAEIFK